MPPFVSPKLISLKLSTDEPTGFLSLLHSSTTTLTHLDLEISLYVYRSGEIDDLQLALQNCTQLVNFRYSEASDPRSQVFMESVFSSLPLLNHLTISSMNFPRPSKFLPSLPTLQTLSIWQPRESLAFVAQLSEYLQDLQDEGKGLGELKVVEIFNYHPELHRYPVDIKRVCEKMGLEYRIEKDWRSLA